MTVAVPPPDLAARTLQLVELPLADVAARIRLRTVLKHAGHRPHPRRQCELLELPDLVVGVDALSEHGKDEPALGLEARRGIGLPDCHQASL